MNILKKQKFENNLNDVSRLIQIYQYVKHLILHGFVRKKI
jgi:hypothetical protein